MLRTLLESDAKTPRRRTGLAASIVIHTVLIGGALAATASARSRGGQDETPPPPIIHYQRTELPAPRLPRSESSRQSDGTTTAGPQRPLDVGRTITYFPDSLFSSRIDVDLGQRVRVDTGSVLCLVLCRPTSGGDSGGPGGGGPATLATVDRGAALVSPPRPRYPEQLRAAGVTGRVIVRLVVDTLGRVEPGTIIVRESSHDLFTHSVRAILPALRFVPAEAGGRRVRMLVDLPFEFRLNE